MTRRPPTSKAKKAEESSKAPKRRAEEKSEKSPEKPTTDFSAERLRVGSWPAAEGKPELETPEKPSAPPEDAPRDDESPLETREEDSSPEETIVAEDSPVPDVRHDFSMVSTDEQALLRAQHNL